MRSNTSWSNSTRSILFTASTTWRMPSRIAMMRVAARLAPAGPCRASTSRMASSAIGGAGRHVAGVLLVARRVGDDEGALLGREIAVGDVDGALLALGGRFGIRFSAAS